MAKVIGESGRYVSDVATRKRNKMLLIGFIILFILGVIQGFVLATSFSPNVLTPTYKNIVFIIALVLIWIIFRVGLSKLDKLDKESDNHRKGAIGENIVGEVLRKFPDAFCVINDLKTPFGNLDHVVIGPTGVFVLDTKNWRGVVSADGKGELLLNGRPTTKREIRTFTARLMNVREKVKLLAPGPDPFHTGLFVFTSARTEAKWGTTGNVHCMDENRLHEYIIDKDYGKHLSPEAVDQISRAFLGLAQMDSGFAQPALFQTPAESSLAPA